MAAEAAAAAAGVMVGMAGRVWHGAGLDASDDGPTPDQGQESEQRHLLSGKAMRLIILSRECDSSVEELILFSAHG